MRDHHGRESQRVRFARRHQQPAKLGTVSSCRDRLTGGVFAAVYSGENEVCTLYATRDANHADVFDFLERFYNPIRRHSTPGYLSPMDFEKAVA